MLQYEYKDKRGESLALKNEQKLIRRIQAHGDRQAGNQLIEFYYKEIYAFVYRQTSDIELSMDLTQDIFLGVLQSIYTYDKKKSSFRTYIYHIAANKTTDYFRSKLYKSKGKLLNIDDLEIEGESTLVQSLEINEISDKALEILSRLNYETQQVVRLKIFGEQNFREISEILLIPSGTVKTKYYSAIRFLRKELDKNGN